MKICFLQVTPKYPNQEHVEMCSKSKDADFYFVTHDEFNSEAIDFCPGTSWAQTRNILAKKVPYKYDYYAFVDYDYELVSETSKCFLDQLKEDLENYKPPVLVPYPGWGLSTPLAKDIKYKKSCDFSIELFSHCGMKVIHASLMDWFFPMTEKFDGGWSASHYFNLMEIPFYRDILMSHRISYNHTHTGGTSDDSSPRNMDKMWQWFRGCINFEHFSKFDEGFNSSFKFKCLKTDNSSLSVKKFFVEYAERKKMIPRKLDGINYLDLDYLKMFFNFDYDHLCRLKTDENYGNYNDK